MHRFFVPPENVGDKKIKITGDDVNHICHVLRMTEGHEMVVSCGRGVDYFCRIRRVLDTEVELEILREAPVETELPVRITLCQSLPKLDKMDWIIQKAVELGAAEVVPVQSRRCVVKLDERKAEKKLTRWRAIAKAAAKQSGRGKIPEIHRVLSFEEALDYAEADLVMIPYELCEDMAGTVHVMEKAADKGSIALFIGPEGGYERGEVAYAMERGALPVSLGKRILRTETAGLAALSVLMFMIEKRTMEES